MTPSVYRLYEAYIAAREQSCLQTFPKFWDWVVLVKP